MVTSAEILAVSTGLTWSVSALTAVLCYNCRRSRCTSLKFCGIEMAREVMTSSEMAQDPAPSNVSAPLDQIKHHHAHPTSSNPLWEDRPHHRRPASIDETKSHTSHPNSQIDTNSEEEEEEEE